MEKMSSEMWVTFLTARKDREQVVLKKAFCLQCYSIQSEKNSFFLKKITPINWYANNKVGMVKKVNFARKIIELYNGFDCKAFFIHNPEYW